MALDIREEIELLCRQMRLPLVVLLFATTTVFYSGVVQGWLWLSLILALFIVVLVDLTPSVLRSFWPWLFFLFFLLYGAGQGWVGMAPGPEGGGYGSYYSWATLRAASYGGAFLLLGLSFSVIVRSQKFWEAFLPCLAIGMFVLLFLSFVQQASPEQMILWRCKFPEWRLFGPFAIKNHFSALIVQTMPMLLGYLHWRWLCLNEGTTARAFGKGYGSVFFRSCLPFLLLLIGFMSFMVFYAMAKLALILFLTAFLVYFFLVLRPGKGVALVLLAVVVLVGLVLFPAVPEHLWAGKFIKPLEHSIAVRLAALGGTLDFWRHHVLFGTGLGTYYYISPSFIPLDFGIWKYAHNDYIEALLETGIVGAGLLLLMAGACLRQGIMNFRRHRQIFWKIMTLQALVSLGLFAMLEASDFHAKIPLNAMVLILQISILFVPPQQAGDDLPRARPLIKSPGMILFLTASFFGVVLLGVFTLRERRYETFYYAGSVEGWQAGVKAFPESAPLWCFLGKAYQASAGAVQGEARVWARQQAVRAFEETARLVPSFPYYWQDLASLQMDNGQYGPARESVRQALYRGPYSRRTRELVQRLKALPSL